MRETSPRRISHPPLRVGRRFASCESSSRDNIGRDWRGQPSEYNLPNCLHPEREHEGRGKGIFAQPREVSIDSALGYTEVPLPAHREMCWLAKGGGQNPAFFILPYRRELNGRERKSRRFSPPARNRSR